MNLNYFRYLNDVKQALKELKLKMFGRNDAYRLFLSLNFSFFVYPNIHYVMLVPLKTKELTTLTILIIIHFWGCISIYGQQVISRPIPFIDKLPINSIWKLYQDKQGFLWIATYNGLSRYDGYEIRSFRNDFNHSDLLVDNDIVCFTEEESHLWIGTNKGIMLINKSNYQIESFPENEFSKQRIKDLLTDDKGNIWIAADNLYRCGTNRKVEKKYSIPGTPNTFLKDKAGSIWVLTWGDGLYKYNSVNDSFIQYPPCGNNILTKMIEDEKGLYWITTWGDGLWRFEPDGDKDKMFKKQPLFNHYRKFPEKIFYDLVQDDTYGYIWALSHFGLYVLKRNEQNELKEVDINKLAGSYNQVDLGKTYSSITKDAAGNLWLGAYDEGRVVFFKKEKIENYVIEDIRRKIGIDANIISLNRDKDGLFWINQTRYGLCLFDAQNGKVTIDEKGELYSIDVRKIVSSYGGESMWVCKDSKVYRTNQEKGHISVQERIDLDAGGSSAGTVMQMAEDELGQLWIGTNRHLFIKEAGKDKAFMTTLGINGINDMAMDTQDMLWISDWWNVYQIKTGNVPALIKQYHEELLLGKDEHLDKICTDMQGNVWLSTSMGRLLSLNAKKGKVTDETQCCGLNGDIITRILSHDKYLWIITNKYIVCHDLVLNDNIFYTTNDDNIFISSFRYGAAFLDDEGNLYAAGYEGFIKITPNKRDYSVASETGVLITDVKVNNESILFSQDGKDRFNSVKKVALDSNDRNIEILFSSLIYEDNSKIKYAYKLDGIDRNWTYIENGKHSAFYNRLGKGQYIFRVKATDTVGNWIDEERELIIFRMPAFYETWYAYLSYIILVVLVIYSAFWIYFRRTDRKNKAKFQEEMAQFKLNYFTNISHELLTPLTIISCVADDWEENSGNAVKQVNILRNNVNRLKRLLQQVLDFRKMDSGRMKLNVDKRNISSFIAGIVAVNFQALARKKSIRLSTEIKEEVWGYTDFDKLDKIFFNLLSNAIKYTPEHKHIHVSLENVNKEGKSYMLLKVKDEGVGIAKADQENIFNRFYNNRNHTGSQSNGIGLSLTKELVNMHHGTIEVESEIEKGSTFTIEIPIDREAYNEEELNEVQPLPNIETDNIHKEGEENSKPCILFIDDNDDLRLLMQSIFKKKYHVLTAADGKEGLELLKENIVDVIICDLMMPKMNGLELCRCVKEEVQTSHIPVIMLTAKNDTEGQVDCYKAGAESYIAKPFDMKVLQARIENLYEACRHRQQKFRSNMEINISDLDFQNADKQFLNDAIRCVEKFIQESDFDVDYMASELHMSRSTLNRKVKAIIGLTPLDFIRNIKLKHACKLLQDKNTTITDIAYATGFSSSRYFTRCFKDEFGMTPTEYQNRQ